MWQRQRYARRQRLESHHIRELELYILSNGTVSNGSLCFLVFKPFTPFLLDNGTFLNSTSCYSPIEHLKIAFQNRTGIRIFFRYNSYSRSLSLQKHGKLSLSRELRFRPVSWRWQWYWMLAVAAFSIMSSITDIDVDRHYLPELPELPIVLSSLF